MPKKPTRRELLKVIDTARAKFHSLAVAAAMVRDGKAAMQPEGFYKIAHEGNVLLGETLQLFPNDLCVRCGKVKDCPEHNKGM
jgi:hypothetical protein